MADITGRMTSSEQAMLTAASGSTSKLQVRLADAIATFNSALAAVGNNVVPGQAVDRFRNDVMAYAVGEWLRDAPLGSGSSKVFWTDSRKDAYKEARQVLDKIANRLAGAVEDPAGFRTTGNWGSENRIISRMHPVPPPLAQFSNVGNNQPEYANPNAQSIVPQDTVPDAPKNLFATPVPNHPGWLMVQWVLPMNAVSFSLWRGAASGAEALLVSGITVSTYVDEGLPSGVPVFYKVFAVNEVGTSAASLETVGTPN